MLLNVESCDPFVAAKVRTIFQQRIIINLHKPLNNKQFRTIKNHLEPSRTNRQNRQEPQTPTNAKSGNNYLPKEVIIAALRACV